MSEPAGDIGYPALDPTELRELRRTAKAHGLGTVDSLALLDEVERLRAALFLACNDHHEDAEGAQSRYMALAVERLRGDTKGASMPEVAR